MHAQRAGIRGRIEEIVHLCRAASREGIFTPGKDGATAPQIGKGFCKGFAPRTFPFQNVSHAPLRWHFHIPHRGM